MEIKTIDAALLSKMFLAGAKNLDAKKEWINELNVFPVPDGDTGTNMTMTIMSAAKEVQSLETIDMPSLAKAISSGSLRGARGNSGVILSQLFRGFTKGIRDYEKIDVVILSDAMQKAVETAYKAVMKPKEGTILTVARGTADRALELIGETEDLTVFIGKLIDHAEYVLSQTPEMLPVLKQAGVVDSGGQGLVQVLKGAYDALLGKEIDYTIEGASAGSGFMKITAETTEEIKFGYCTEFIVVLNHPLSDKQEREFKDFLEGIGDSIVLVADDEIVKVHVHTNDPGLAIQKALTHGSLSRIKIDNMREEHQEKLFKDAQKLAAAQKEEEQSSASESEKASAPAGGQADAKADGKEETVSAPRKPVGFVTVSIGEGMNEIFKGLGADEIIEGGQTMNPCTEDFLNAIDKVNADTVFLLPNNKNIILAANQAALMNEEKNIVVIPTKTVPQGITALISYMPEDDAETNENNMKEGIAAVKTGQVTYAVRDTVIEDKQIKEGDFMGIGDSGILSVGTDMLDVVKDMVEQMMDEDASIISMYYGADATKEDVDALTEHFEKEYPDCELEVHLGGQPIYYYIVSVE